MKIIVVGIGKLGEYLTRSLVREDNEVTLIDKDFSLNKELINNEDVNYVCGNALDSNVLIEAGVKECDLIICVMNMDEQNILCSLLAKKLGAKNTIARIRSLEYSSSINLLKDELGLSMTINPEQLTALNIAKTLSIPSALNATSFLKGKLQMISLKIKKDSILNGMSITNLSKKHNLNIIVCAIERHDKLKFGDMISVCGTIKDINEFLTFANLISNETKKVMIAGGSKTSVYLAKYLLDMNMKVKIIEINNERCKELSELLPGVLIINADVSNQDILYEEGIEEVDAFISLTSIDEENIVYSMFASIKNIPKVITKVNHIDLTGIVEKANIDTVITPHRIAANQIVKYVRAIKNSEKSSCEAIYKFNDDNFEMQEFNIKNDFLGIDMKIKDMKIKNNILIVAIQRGRNVIMANGNEKIKLNDTIVVIDSSNSIREINDILE